MLPTAGIDALSFYCPRYVLDMRALARWRGLAEDHFAQSVGQDRMAVPPPGEDVVTMAANAALPVLERHGRDNLELLIFATETGIDQSKAAGLYVHRLLGLPARCRVFEVKQACYGATAALQMACALVRSRPQARALILAADIARYGLGTPGEATQGGGAVAMLVTATPRVLAIDPESGYFADDVMDFWRPNYRDEALVDGKASVRIYLHALRESWRQLAERSPLTLAGLARCCYHLPFTRMAEMAHFRLARELAAELPPEHVQAQIAASTRYNATVGNSYAASLYVALCSLLDAEHAQLHGQRLGLFSYGSGCMGEFFTGTVGSRCAEGLFAERHRRHLAERREIDCATYERFYRFALPTDGSDLKLPEHDTGAFRLVALRRHQRLYAAV